MARPIAAGGDRVVPHVRILMGTHQGAAHLGEQLGSFLAQGHGAWSLWASDDGSTDGTRALLDAFRRDHPTREVRLLDGPRQGAAANFLSLVGRAAAEGEPAHLALADQDDVWLPHRLSRALDVLAREGAGVYASRTVHADARLRPGRLSTLHPRPPAFANALVQNVLAGNTLVLDPAAARLLAATVPAASPGGATEAGVPHHDWWAYLVATGAGAAVALDPEPGLLYRQHGGNLMGAHEGPGVAWDRLRALGRGTWRDWVGRNLAALAACRTVLTPEARALMGDLAALRRLRSPLARLRALDRSPLHRQTRGGQAALRALALLGRL